MDYRAAFEISAAGMAVEKTRVDVVALNLAHMHTTAPTEAGRYQPLRAVSRERAVGFAQWMDALGETASLSLPEVQVEPAGLPPRLVHEPSHPHADAQGMVAYPGVDHTSQMLQLVEALRAYEANVAAANIARSMAGRALEIGGQT